MDIRFCVFVSAGSGVPAAWLRPAGRDQKTGFQVQQQLRGAIGAQRLIKLMPNWIGSMNAWTDKQS